MDWHAGRADHHQLLRCGVRCGVLRRRRGRARSAGSYRCLRQRFCDNHQRLSRQRRLSCTAVVPTVATRRGRGGHLLAVVRGDVPSHLVRAARRGARCHCRCTGRAARRLLVSALCGHPAACAAAALLPLQPAQSSGPAGTFGIEGAPICSQPASTRRCSPDGAAFPPTPPASSRPSDNTSFPGGGRPFRTSCCASACCRRSSTAARRRYL